MGLAERKVKQRIGSDPRNLSWSGDTNRFSYKHMTALGWNDAKGLGQSGDGNPNHIAVVHKLDNGGIGMARARKEGDDNAAGAGQAGRGLEDVLKRLAAASASASPSPAPESPAEASASDKEVKKRNKIASRQRHLASKRLASSSPAALAEILGVPVASLPASPSPSAPATPAKSSPEPASPDPDTERTAEETVKKSTLSVTDYFRQKMREKMLARQAAAGGGDVPSMPEGSLAVVKEEKKVDIGGVAWEGSKMEFKEEAVELADLGAEAGPSVKLEDSVEIKLERDDVDEKAAKRARKEAKRAKKLAEGEVKLEAIDVKPTAEEMASSVESDEARARREKKERKEEKRRLKEAGGKGDKKKRKREDEAGDSEGVKKERKD